MTASVSTRTIAGLHGTPRLIALSDALRQINKYHNQQQLLDFWNTAESLLAEVVPDNTDATRTELVELLNQAHAYCSNRELAKSLMAMRNRMLDQN